MFGFLCFKVLVIVLKAIPAAIISDQVVGMITQSLSTGSLLWFGEERIPKSLK